MEQIQNSLLHGYSVRACGTRREGGVEIEIETGIEFKMIPIDLDYANLVIALEVDLAEVIFIQEVVNDH